ncbi:MAG TPA: N-acetylmuramoyl-L-alanine amidase [Chthoniobacteraceae bacterium]|nr:N-acetylmuramoyl-L-alanine amidase [Chthoniobacteraceae bacterium]
MSLHRLIFLSACVLFLGGDSVVAVDAFSHGPSKVIVIDPGHGGPRDVGTDAAKTRSSSNNATSPSGRLKEKDLTLELAKAVAARIEASDAAKAGRVRVVLTRTTDVNRDFAERAAVAARESASCFVSIHFNAAAGRAGGPRAVVQQEGRNANFAADRDFGMSLARAVQVASQQFRPTPVASFHDDHELHGGAGSYLFHQLAQNEATRRIPSCQLEVEFLDNRDVEDAMLRQRKAEVIEAWARAIADALVDLR